MANFKFYAPTQISTSGIQAGSAAMVEGAKAHGAGLAAKGAAIGQGLAAVGQGIMQAREKKLEEQKAEELQAELTQFASDVASAPTTEFTYTDLEHSTDPNERAIFDEAERAEQDPVRKQGYLHDRLFSYYEKQGVDAEEARRRIAELTKPRTGKYYSPEDRSNFFKRASELAGAGVPAAALRLALDGYGVDGSRSMTDAIDDIRARVAREYDSFSQATKDRRAAETDRRKLMQAEAVEQSNRNELDGLLSQVLPIPSPMGTINVPVPVGRQSLALDSSLVDDIVTRFETQSGESGDRLRQAIAGPMPVQVVGAERYDRALSAASQFSEDPEGYLKNRGVFATAQSAMDDLRQRADKIASQYKAGRVQQDGFGAREDRKYRERADFVRKQEPRDTMTFTELSEIKGYNAAVFKPYEAQLKGSTIKYEGGKFEVVLSDSALGASNESRSAEAEKAINAALNDPRMKPALLLKRFQARGVESYEDAENFMGWAKVNMPDLHAAMLASAAKPATDRTPPPGDLNPKGDTSDGKKDDTGNAKKDDTGDSAGGSSLYGAVVDNQGVILRKGDVRVQQEQEQAARDAKAEEERLRLKAEAEAAANARELQAVEAADKEEMRRFGQLTRDLDREDPRRQTREAIYEVERQLVELNKQRPQTSTRDNAALRAQISLDQERLNKRLAELNKREEEQSGRKQYGKVDRSPRKLADRDTEQAFADAYADYAKAKQNQKSPERQAIERTQATIDQIQAAIDEIGVPTRQRRVSRSDQQRRQRLIELKKQEQKKLEEQEKLEQIRRGG